MRTASIRSEISRDSAGCFLKQSNTNNMKNENTQPTHTQEPWHTHPAGETNVIYNVLPSGEAVEICRTPANTQRDKADARRICAAINATSQISTETLESLASGDFNTFTELSNEIDRIRQQNSELVQLLKVIKIEGEITRITTLFSLESAIFNHQTEPTT